MTEPRKITHEQLSLLFALLDSQLPDTKHPVKASDLKALVTEVLFYRGQIESQKASELAELAARAGLTGKIEKLARALASTTCRYGKPIPERQTIGIPYAVFTLLERGFKAIRDADELAITRVMKNLEELPQPEDMQT